MPTLAEQKAAFYRVVSPSRPNEWEVDELFAGLAELDSESRELLLGQVPAIWPVSHSLCYAFLSDAPQAMPLLPRQLLPEWVRQLLAAYESRGLYGAREFMAAVDRLFLGPLRGEAGVAFSALAPLLRSYIQGVAGRPLELATGPLPATDGRTIYLPETIDLLPEKAENILLYKLLVSLQWLHAGSPLFTELALAGGDPFAHFPEPTTARDLFAVLRFQTVSATLSETLPGLARAATGLVRRLIAELASEGPPDRCHALRRLLSEVVPPRPASDCAGDRLAELATCYARFSPLPGSYRLGPCALLLGSFDFVRAGEVIRQRREEQKNRFVRMAAAFLHRQTAAETPDAPAAVATADQDAALLLLTETTATKRRQQHRRLENEGTELPAELAALIAELSKEFGAVPANYLQAAVGMSAGAGPQRGDGEGGTADAEAPPAGGCAYPYDEWDFRRGGYRHHWCTLYEKPLSPVQSTFVSATLEKYRPQLRRLRRQFEMLRTSRRLVRRRRYGDEIDLDALIEALGDRAAGRQPSDRLFFRQLRDERDITALFLIDMSNSTEGWVGLAMKEALVLLAESLEVVGDRYGMYGFSGMRRSRSDLFLIKDPAEPYGTLVRHRIAAISPREYTRMGPPLRHLTRRLAEMPGRVRLLVVISDGKPEDYDDYRGDYAIEDTRRALLEARGCGIYPFCITIDRQAQEYLGHMFGRGNYIFVDNVLSLPARMAEMYRLLTS